MTTMVTVVQRDDNNPAPLLTAHNEAYPSGLLTFARPSVPLLAQSNHSQSLSKASARVMI
jgi:hypothetical protein